MAHILLMEDDVDFSSLLADSLEEAGHSVRLFANATDALRTFKPEKYDIVIADLLVKKGRAYIPDGGLILISGIRRASADLEHTIPIIAMSGSVKSTGMQDVLTTASQVGADATLAKPFAPSEMLALIDRLLNEFEIARQV